MDGVACASGAILRSSAFGAAGDHDLGFGGPAEYGAVWGDDDTLVREGSVSTFTVRQGKALTEVQHAEEWEAEM